MHGKGDEYWERDNVTALHFMVCYGDVVINCENIAPLPLIEGQMNAPSFRFYPDEVIIIKQHGDGPLAVLFSSSKQNHPELSAVLPN
jgi:hypothetical protein